MVDDDHLWTNWAPNEEDEKDRHWIELKSGSGKMKFNVVCIQEAVGLGQRVQKHGIYVDGARVVKGSTIGYKRLHRLQRGVVWGDSVRIKFVKARGTPLISSIGLHWDPFWNPRKKAVSLPAE